MKLTFKISYFTHWGQNLYITGNAAELGAGDISKAIPMNFEPPESWSLAVDINAKNLSELRYSYFIKDENSGKITPEWNVSRVINLNISKKEIVSIDAWNSVSAVENNFLTSPFQNVLLKRTETSPLPPPKEGKRGADDGLSKNATLRTPSPLGRAGVGCSHIFSVKAPLLQKNETVCVIGNCAELGDWSVENPVLMSQQPLCHCGLDPQSPENKTIAGQARNDSAFSIALNLSAEKNDIHYKYGVYDVENKAFKYFESGADRIVPSAAASSQVVVNDTFVRMANNSFHGAGVSIPVFALRSERSFGVGDFTDLMKMADWAKKVGLKLIQVLPLNDTIGTHTEADVLPYAAISAFALNPLFLDLEKLDKLPKDSELSKKFEAKREQLNSLAMMDFLSVINFKLSYAKEAFLNNKEKFLASKDFKNFYKENAHWLEPYAIYCCLRDKFHTCDYRNWGEFADYQNAKIHFTQNSFTQSSQRNTQRTQNNSSALSAQSPRPLREITLRETNDNIALNYYIQYHLHIQLKAAAEYAHSCGVILKGDIPIGVNRNSVDTWVSPELFNMDTAAGAPPDLFSVKGQNWELPTYNWAKIEETSYDWWKKRFQQMGNYFDAFRIDHILGFFRIWEIPTYQIEGIMGHLNPSIPIYADEFQSRGVQFDYERFCVPYITDHILWDNFGEEAEWVKNNCLYIKYGFAYRIKDEYATQAAVEQLFNAGKISERVKWGLFDLISNVLLFEVPNTNGQQFYPRYDMEKLPTFRALDEHQQRVFRELYVDYFYRRQDAFWYELGLKKLSALKQATNMLICGEDLGMMTHCVTSVMNELSILSLEIQRAPKDDKKTFFHPADAPYLSVVSPSTHDMSTIRGWWEEDRAVSQKFYNNELGHWGDAPFFCEWWLVRDVILQHLYSPAMLAIFQWQDLLGMSHNLRRENPNDERINVPSNSRHSWRYRMHLTLEKLLECDDFNNELRNYIEQAGR
ncbi:MAG: 4-alpha-glucanotransferase [Prevotellaceae bacterium]|jgi:4-alpha-glucanotransferase|nr:4-alpha-glucanotransferase [Prevotellaceae bacterium]